MDQVKDGNGWSGYYKLTKKISVALKSINISTFIFYRFNKKSEFLVLSNQWEMMDYCLCKSEISPYIKSIIKRSTPGKISVNLWPKDNQDPLLRELHRLKIGNGISLALHFGEYVDIFLFGADIENQDMKNFYINHIKLLKRFITYFRAQAKAIIHDAYCNKMIRLKEKISLYSNPTNRLCEELSQFSKEILPKKIVIKHNEKKISLSSRETTCLLLMQEGKSMKSIADSLGISPKTVEAFVQKIKWKTGCNTKANLLSLLLDKKTDSGVY